MKDEEIDTAEHLYVWISNGYLNGKVANDIVRILEKTECGVYLEWLLNRWSMLRRDKNHLPKRITKKNISINLLI